MANTYCQDVVLIHCPHCGRPIYVTLDLDEWFDRCPECEDTYGVTIKWKDQRPISIEVS